MSEQPRTPEEEAEEFLRTGRLTRTHFVTPEQARERFPDAAAIPDRPPDEVHVLGVDDYTREVRILERWHRPPNARVRAMELHVDTGPDYRSEMRAARDRIAELEAEVEALRKAAGWSDNDAPALGGERAEGLDAIPTHVRLDDVREARRALWLD